MVLFAGLIAAMLIFAVMTWWSIVVGFCLWLAAVAIFSRMGKADPALRPIYRRHLRYKSFYFARPGLLSQKPRPPRSWG